MENNITILSSIGCSNYYITENGSVFKKGNTDKEVKQDKLNRFYLIDDNGKEIRITARKLYKKVFNIQICEDNIISLKGEEWKPILNADNKYFISNYGRVKSYCGRYAIILKPYMQKSGYLEVKLNGKNVKVHKLVADAFCINRFNGTDIRTEVHHINKAKNDNRADNLQILSIKEHHEAHTKKEVYDNE